MTGVRLDLGDIKSTCICLNETIYVYVYICTYVSIHVYR